MLPNLDFDVDTLSGMKPLRPVTFSIGSNIEDRLEYLQGAVSALARTPQLKIVDVSSVYETKPVGPITDQPDFLNIIVEAESTLASLVLLDRAHAIEAAFQRTRTVVGGPRTVDVDLINVGRRVIDSPEIQLPHPRAHERAFVLVPWYEVEPAAELAGVGRIADLLVGLDTRGVIERPDLVIEL